MYSALLHIKSYILHHNTPYNITVVQINGILLGIHKLFMSLINKDTYLFHDIKRWIDDKWVRFPSPTINTVTQVWSICILQPKILDIIFTEQGAALKLWLNLRKHCGKFGKMNELNGFAYTNDGDYISAEVTFAALLACKILKIYYKEQADLEPLMITRDTETMSKYLYNNLLVKTDNEAYFIHTNCSETTFEINNLPSTVATSWYLFYSKGFNPFMPNGSLLYE
jgi:hypothetical protein